MNITNFRKWTLTLAEAIDALRAVPRMILVAYGCLVWILARWYMAIETHRVIECDSALMNTLLLQKVDLATAKSIACSATAIVGGPTTEQTAFVSIIVGLSSAVIGLYLSTGVKSKWQGDVIGSILDRTDGRSEHRDHYRDSYRGGSSHRPGRSWFGRRGSTYSGADGADTSETGQPSMPSPEVDEDEYRG